MNKRPGRRWNANRVATKGVRGQKLQYLAIRGHFKPLRLRKASVTCSCCGGESKKSGKFKNVNGVIQRFQCLKCGKTFSARQAFENVKIERAKVVQIVKLIGEGMGIRATSRLTGCHTHTVMAALVEVGEACRRMHDRIVREVKTDAVQLDELWSRVGVRQSRTTESDTERGDFYTFLGVAAREKLIVSYETGKRDVPSTQAFVSDLAERIPGRIQVTTDGFQAYPAAIREHMLGRLDYAVLVKKFATPIGEVEAQRRYSPAPFIGLKRTVKAGNPRHDRICTSHVERTNLTVRHFNKRFARLGLGWSRKLVNHKAAIDVFVAVYNFCKVHSTLGCTPAVGANLTDHSWTVEELIERATAE
jgi:transposase-like protein/IS1 family transposase